ncbi:pyrroline-5-carboxylate reductase family protein [Sphingorhabdus arenilitoris]|uniref:Pyrroline-5-carboxylate reductase n=1 Tax=Sphingorhabdus arenilitoris TaxID=1490041 RepID=A0ABV8RDB0_9SPHN
MTDSAAAFPAPMLLFGCGNMAGAMVTGWMAAGVPGAHFHIVKPTDRNIPADARHFTTADQPGQKYDQLMIGIKPYMLAEMAQEIAALLNPGALVISIMGGVSTDSLARHFPGARILRVMPNLAVALGKSPLGLFAKGLSEADKADAEKWLCALGTPYWMPAEEDMHAFTAIAGCAPAYLYRFIDALAAAGTKLGIEAEQAERLAREMTEGAALLAAQSPFPPAELASRVASKGGSTAAGLAVMDEDKAILRLMENTLRAAHDRSVEQGKEAEA